MYNMVSKKKVSKKIRVHKLWAATAWDTPLESFQVSGSWTGLTETVSDLNSEKTVKQKLAVSLEFLVWARLSDMLQTLNRKVQ